MNQRLDPRYLPLHRVLRMQYEVKVNQIYKGKVWPMAVSEKQRGLMPISRVVYLRARMDGEVNVRTTYMTDGNVTIEAPFDFIVTTRAQEMVLGELRQEYSRLEGVPDGIAARILGLTRRKVRRVRNSSV